MKYLKECWYMVGWADDFAPETLVPFTLLGEAVVIFRKSDGSFGALEDRCCHRLAPLSCGRLEGDDVRCMYHGLKFNAQGACIEIPGQERISAKVRVRSYPALERHSAIWLWMGEGEADEQLIPDFVGVNHPDWAMVPGRMDYQAHYRLINDNLLDLSHLTYVHNASDSFAAEDQWALSKMQVQPISRGVRVGRWIEAARLPGTLGQSDEITDRWTTYDFLVPGIFLLYVYVFEAGTAARCNHQEPPANLTPLRQNFTCQAVTPLTEKTSSYFFAIGPNVEHADKKHLFFQMANTAFAEDRQIIEAQQKCIDRSPDVAIMPLAMDQAVTRFNRMFDEMIAAETGRLNLREVEADAVHQ
ncbi:aromatic ring-hydroxylating dioxygenase subunit alpha [Pseudomonas sp. R5(2019)]|uniref:aromatic ring-hydroxylating dioxygenase subunit alpha n=1 Tax=Pseudomonas sp. R5(2019) TaxID=2697566 RepID=UPI001411C19B|nr:aromatic ring-hydroxylating dioxygenase subunit alpha [Pseudomonas sp. R5(2019)]NBA96016.1 Rieske 2Fe-2S domain-containing protein [Pseudomonas sp. R5(2019)]